MFTGIIEALGTVQKIEREGTNLHFTIESAISAELKPDQSIAHNGVCLTVVAVKDQTHTVTAIAETLHRTNLGQLRVGDFVNLERAMSAQARLDGHIVQGHVDKTGVCVEKMPCDGSWIFTFEYEMAPEHLLVDKGSVCVNGVSLTVVEPEISGKNKTARFSVAIIPYTFEHTNFRQLAPGDRVNLEFDIIGKYISKYLSVYANGKVF
ncbi:MAG: riboflavin synthase [Bacteroidetes bacterium]|nr:MAG: riboflavin synthase [Bacteroidota bacterium]